MRRLFDFNHRDVRLNDDDDSYEYKYSVNDIKIFVNIQSIDWRLRLNSVILILLISLQKRLFETKRTI